MNGKYKIPFRKDFIHYIKYEYKSFFFFKKTKIIRLEYKEGSIKEILEFENYFENGKLTEFFIEFFSGKLKRDEILEILKPGNFDNFFRDFKLNFINGGEIKKNKKENKENKTKEEIEKEEEKVKRENHISLCEIIGFYKDKAYFLLENHTYETLQFLYKCSVYSDSLKAINQLPDDYKRDNGIDIKDYEDMLVGEIKEKSKKVNFFGFLTKLNQNGN